MTALHVKYRPSSFDEVLGQDRVVKSLRNVVKEGRAKTFIFTGPSGTGKTTLARILAKEFAGAAFNQLNIEEFPAALKSGADDVRDVVARSAYCAIGAAPTKAIVIDECHRLSQAAWNVLLKPIEEPPKHIYWMFCSTEPDKIPKAIWTRCLRYDLNPVSEDLLFELLIKVADAEKLKVSDEILDAIATGSNGSPRQALVFLEECAHCETHADALRIMQTAGGTKEIIDLCRLIVSGRGNWMQAMKIIKAMEGVDPESARIVIVNYLGAILLNSKSNDKAVAILGLLECFQGPYHPAEKLAPLFRSLGMAFNLDR